VLWLTILVALAIPLAAVILDSPVVRALADRTRRGDAAPSGEVKQLAQKVETLETEIEVVNRELAQLKEGQQFLQQMLENPATPREAPKLPKPPA
jgi:TolA-binding protein